MDPALDQFATRRQSTLRQLLGAAPVEHKVLELSGPAWGPLAGQRVGLRALSAQQQLQGVADAIAWLTTTAKMDRDDVYTETGQASLDLETKVQWLSRALVQVEDPKRAWVEGPADVRELLRPEQVTWLFDRYAEYQRERSPYELLADAKKLEEVVDGLGKGWISPTSLSSCDASSLRYIALGLASRLRSLTTLPSSGTGSPDASGDGSSPGSSE